jgi:hypothetical protein
MSQSYIPEGESGNHPCPEAVYYAIAKDALAKDALAKAESLAAATSDDASFERTKAVTTAMVFSALCLEAFINQEYFARPETKKILKKAEQSFESKWLELPHLLGSHATFDKSAMPYLAFHELVLTRNRRLVHFKPDKEQRLEGDVEKIEQQYLGDLMQDFKTAERFVGCVEGMMRELARLTSGKTSIPLFLAGDKYTGQVQKTFTGLQESRGPRSQPEEEKRQWER